MIHFVGINVKYHSWRLSLEPYLIHHNWSDKVSKSHYAHILFFHSSIQTHKSFKIISNKQLHLVANSFESYILVLPGLQVLSKEKGVNRQ